MCVGRGVGGGGMGVNQSMKCNTVNPLYNDIHHNSRICYNVNLVCTKISGSCIFSLTVSRYSLGKHSSFRSDSRRF